MGRTSRLSKSTRTILDPSGAAMNLPSGDQEMVLYTELDGRYRKVATVRSPPPSDEPTTSSDTSDRSRRNAIRSPSGDQQGAYSTASSWVMRSGGASSPMCLT